MYAVSSFLVQHSANILASQQYGESPDGRFFMRVHFSVPPPGRQLAELERGFSWVAEAFHMAWQLHDKAARVRTLIMVSRLGHCLNDLLFRWKTGSLPVDVVGVVSNHDDFGELAVCLYGSLGLTGPRHGSDKAVLLGLEGEQPATVDVDAIPSRLEAIARRRTVRLLGEHEIAFTVAEHLEFNRRKKLGYHPNGMCFTAYDGEGEAICERAYYSIGGGFVADETAARSAQARPAARRACTGSSPANATTMTRCGPWTG
jgi:hypothetical protein